MSKKRIITEELFDEFNFENTIYLTRVPDSYKNRKAYKPLNINEITAFIPGTIRDVMIKVGDHVEKGDSLMTLEAMKMNNDVKSPLQGVIKNIFIQEGMMVRKNQILVEIE